MLKLPVHDHVKVVLVRPHYPENVGAAARAMKTMGFTRLVLVKPGRLAQPSHEMARKMAVKSLDVLDGVQIVSHLTDALFETELVVGSTARSGVSHILSLEQAAERALTCSGLGRRSAFLFGNEKTGLDRAALEACHKMMRIPMAAAQPSVNLAQAVQLLAYELFKQALASRPSATDGIDLYPGPPTVLERVNPSRLR